MPQWWDKSLELLKKDVLRKKRRIRNAAPSRIEHVTEEYRATKKEYKTKIEEAQIKSWKEFCAKQQKESMWDGVYRVIRKTDRNRENVLLKDNQGNTLDPQKSADLLAKTFYPDDSEDSDSNYHQQLRSKYPEENLTEDDPPFNKAELETILTSLNPNKAPGPDGLTSDICSEAIMCAPEVFLEIANKCLQLGHFPKQWKQAHVVILRKPGKEDYTHPKSYRPIGLLSILGKIVEKLMINRVQWHILPTLNKNQYGFIPQRSTEDALYDLVDHIKEEVRNKKKIVLLISLDIEGAFDNAWWPALKHQLIKKGCPSNIYRMICSYLEDRKITVNYAGKKSEKGTNKGCVQGSIGGPTFWNIILDPLLDELTTSQVKSEAFADDITLIFSGETIEAVEEKANTTLRTVANWGKRNKLNFAAHKTNAMVLTRKLKLRTPEIYMSGTKINIVKEVKLLGVIIDRSLTFTSHITSVCKKAANIYKQIAHSAKVTWGLNGEIIRTIYISVIEPIILYAASVWAPATDLNTTKNLLDSIQRSFAIKICKAYRTASLTSTLTLAGILPLDIRIQEAAALYKTKKGLSSDYIPPGKCLQTTSNVLTLPHPSDFISTTYEKLEDMTPQTITQHQIEGPQIYTDGSKIEGKTGAAVTWWENGEEVKNTQLSLDPNCTVFQSEMFALHKAVEMAKGTNHREVNILSDSRSSLELIRNPKPNLQLAADIKTNIKAIEDQGRKIRFFWLRAHVGTPGNERADELAKQAALSPKATPDYNQIPLSYIKRKIRQESIRIWQDRYTNAETGETTRRFLPNIIKSYRFNRTTKLSPTHIQALTGHGAFAHYLHRFKLSDSPGCECDEEVSETVWHIIFDCPRFLKQRHDVEHQLNINLQEASISEYMENQEIKEIFLIYIESVFNIARQRHKDKTRTTATTTPSDLQISRPQQTTTQLNIITWLSEGESGSPQVRTRKVVLFMNTNYERLGISFCSTSGSKRVAISPGLALLLKGSTTRTTIKRRRYEELGEVEIAGMGCRIVRTKNKSVLLFDKTPGGTQFTRACSFLTKLAELNNTTCGTKTISVDQMSVDYSKGEVVDYIGCAKAGKHHEVVVYEGRQEDLNFLVHNPPPRRASPLHQTQPEHQVTAEENTDTYNLEPTSRTNTINKIKQKIKSLTSWKTPLNLRSPGSTETILPGPSTSTSKSNAEIWAEKEAERKKEREAEKRRCASIMRHTQTTRGKVDRQIHQLATGPNISLEREKQEYLEDELPLKPNTFNSPDIQTAALNKFFTAPKPPAKTKQNTRPTQAQLGLIKPPTFRIAERLEDHMINAFHEYTSIVNAIRTLKIKECEDIMKSFKLQKEDFLQLQLEKAEAAIYNNNTSTVLKGEKTKRHMAAYSDAAGLVLLDEDRTKRSGHPVYNTPPHDPVVIVTKGTEIWLEDKILDNAKILSEIDPPDNWTIPDISWVNGVPGCGKTTWIINNFKKEEDIVVTTTVEAKNDLKKRINKKAGSEAMTRVRTLASILADGPKVTEGFKCNRLLVDEALMNHFGSIVMIVRMVRAKLLLIIGDVNQLPYIDREHLFPLHYCRPNHLTDVTEELLCTHRCPKDVAYALQHIHKGIYSSSDIIRSLSIRPMAVEEIPRNQPKTLFLTYTQKEKNTLNSQGYGKGEGSKTLTIHEAQGLCYERVCVINTTERRMQLHNSASHAVVALTRHTKSLIYFTNNTDDALGNLIKGATTKNTTEKTIMDYNLKMAIKNRDHTNIQKMVSAITHDGNK